MSTVSTPTLPRVKLISESKETYICLHKNGVSILLILGRRINQSIVFPNCGITVRILDVNGRVAKIGIEAPRSVAIMRGELVIAAQSSIAHSALIEKNGIEYKQNAAPENDLPVMQFSQRLSEIKACIHLFQQLRAVGDEAGADQVLGDLLNEISDLDSDCLKGIADSSTALDEQSNEYVSESITDYQIGRTDPIQILVVNEPNNCEGISLPFGTFHGCQLCTVNNRPTALKAIETNEHFNYVVCNGSPMAFDELDLVRTIRANHRLDNTRIFMTSVSENALERLELSRTYRIDGWLTRPLLMHDLWKHIVESEQIES